MYDTFNSFLGTIYGVFAVGVLLGALTWLSATLRSPNAATIRQACGWTLIGLIPLVWRFGAGISVSRYNLLLIVPAVMLTVYFFCSVRRPWLRWTLAAVAIGCCLAKVCNFNPHSREMIELAEWAGRDSRSYRAPGGADFSNGNTGRWEFYSKLRLRSLDVRTDFLPAGPVIRMNLPSLRLNHDVLYFFISERVSEPSITAEQVGVAAASWTKCRSVYRNSRKKTLYTLYRYLPAADDLRHRQNWQPRIGSPENAGFEQHSTGAMLEYHFRSQSGPAAKGEKAETLLYPAKWFLLPGPAGNPPLLFEGRLNAANPISGQFSFEISSEAPVFFSTLATINFPLARRTRVTARVRALDREASICLQASFRNAAGTALGSGSTEYRLAPGQTLECELPLPDAGVAGVVDFRWFGIVNHGRVLWDDIAIEDQN